MIFNINSAAVSCDNQVSPGIFRLSTFPVTLLMIYPDSECGFSFVVGAGFDLPSAALIERPLPDTPGNLLPVNVFIGRHPIDDCGLVRRFGPAKNATFSLFPE
jgi:hypothetical protein